MSNEKLILYIKKNRAENIEKYNLYMKMYMRRKNKDKLKKEKKDKKTSQEKKLYMREYMREYMRKNRLKKRSLIVENKIIEFIKPIKDKIRKCRKCNNQTAIKSYFYCHNHLKNIKKIA